MMEFHVSRSARDLYQFDQGMFQFTGNVIFANFHAARVFAQKMNARRDLLRFPEQAVSASDLNAMGLIDEILHLIVARYRQQVEPALWRKIQERLAAAMGEGSLKSAVLKFSEDFPPVAVYQRKQQLEEYLKGQTDGMEHWDAALEEMLMLWLANLNPAFSPYSELFDDAELERHTPYLKIMEEIEGVFRGMPGFGPGGKSLIDMLRAPALASPHSLAGQLAFLRDHWAAFIGEDLFRLLTSLDFIEEENRVIFTGKGPALPPDFRMAEGEPEQYSPDKDWMPRLVLLAKNTYVWLDQLSKKFQREIRTLDQVPDEELDEIAARGISGIWLIGVWERSQASRSIKQRMGNPEAAASAYSLHDYEVAHDLGGPGALAELKRRAWERGVRMASDMVPNHMAIDSRWVMQHPHWFLGLPHSPYPSYTFNGPNLSNDSRAGIYLEDHYYNHSDAAVVFKRVDHQTGEERYIYHGNDGTNMPWNDTAQLDYLNPEVREGVIQTILHVARQFPIIRFDAAMTLAKKHIQRLWFPEPGSGGGIPSRSEYGVTRQRFDELMPKEFWREVVDRVAEEAPDTLLLAEAFWLLEGYFVRTLGMHRVYNSAFMHMLRDEDNAKYRYLIASTLEFDPQILKRYVNFMSNPDEDTAVAQFGKGDKYFGICTVMATVPGLPMFGHGQFEGYAEKYGMEYRRAYWDEQPDQHLVYRHRTEITPLLQRRQIFAEVENFRLYDFYEGGGGRNENVIAFSNRYGEERSLVVFHNRFAEARGWVRNAVPVARKESDAMLHQDLGTALGIHNDPNNYVIFRDHCSGLQYIRNAARLCAEGLYLELGAYNRHVFWEFEQKQDNHWGQYAQLTDYLNGAGVPSIDEAVKELLLRPLHQAFRDLLDPEILRFLSHLPEPAPGEAEVVEHWPEPPQAQPKILEDRLATFLRAAHKQASEAGMLRVDPAAPKPDMAEVASGHMDDLIKLQRAMELRARMLEEDRPVDSSVLDGLGEMLKADRYGWIKANLWVLLSALDHIGAPAIDGLDHCSRAWFDEWLLAKQVATALKISGASDAEAAEVVGTVRILLNHGEWTDAGVSSPGFEAIAPETRPLHYLSLWLKDREIQHFLGINRYQGVLWYNRESLEIFLAWMMAVGFVGLTSSLEGEGEELAIARAEKAEAGLAAMAKTVLEASEAASYKVENLLDNLRPG
jgi:hypothetical protein